MSKKTIAVAAVLLGLATTGALAQTNAGGLVKGGESPDLHLIFTGDVIGYIEPCG